MRLEDPREGTAVFTHSSHLRESHPSTNRGRALRVVPDPETEEFAQLLAELAAEQRESASEPTADAWESLPGDDEALLALGLPVAQPAGDDLPDVVDERADVHEATVIRMRTAQLHRYLREMDPLDSKVMRLVWGIGCRPHTQMEAAARTGRSRAAVRSALARSMDELCVRFGAELHSAA